MKSRFNMDNKAINTKRIHKNNNILRWIDRLLPVGLILLISALVFLPFAWKLGFYRDDWYVLWSANTRGASSIIDLFSIDRPFMGYTYALTYRLLGNSPVGWQIYATVLKALGAWAVYAIVRLIWPGQKPAAIAASLIYLVYPGFLEQPNAGTMTNQLLSLNAVLWSIWLSGMAILARSRRVKVALILLAVLLSLLNLFLYEYMVGLELLRLGVLWFVLDQGELFQQRGRIRRLFNQWWPYLGLVLAFLVWRLVVFKSERVGADQFAIVQSMLASPRIVLTHLSLQTIMDTLETFFMAWGVPLHQYAMLEKPRLVLIALAIATLTTAAALSGLWLYRRLDNAEIDRTRHSHALKVCLLGIAAFYAAIFPVLLSGRDIHYSSGFNRYTLHASPAVAILLVGVIFGFVRGRMQQVFLAAFLFLGVSTHILNAFYWERFWENQKAVWQQLNWRAPGLKDGTILIVSFPEEGYFEDYEAWGPANLIYRPGLKAVTIGAQVPLPETTWKVWSGLVEERSMRKLTYVRDYKKSLVLELPADNSCLKVVDSNDIALPMRYETRLIPLLEFSHIDQIDVYGQNSGLPSDLFGDDLDRGWCYFYQSAELFKQAGDWDTVAELGNEAIAASARPVDRVEWLPFLEAYLYTGDTEKAGYVTGEINADYPLVRQVCDALVRNQYAFGETLQQELNQALCTDK
jgi:hypothetical protein